MIPESNYAQDKVINFYEYQRLWLKDKSRFKIGMFSRQSGKTFTTCAEIVEDCIDHEIEGKRTRWVILSRGERQSKEAMDEAIKPLIKAFYHVYNTVLQHKKPPEEVEYDYVVDKGKGKTATYKALEVTFPSGSRITALPANPDTARGFSANVLLDEFAFHADSREIWKALFPVISKGGLKLRVVSTPNGKGNKFYDLMTGGPGWEERGLKIPEPDEDGWSRHITDIYKAVKQGLDRDIPALKAALRDQDAWEQEFELKWKDEASAWLDYDLISTVEHPLAGRPELYSGGHVYIGNDIASRKDLWVAWVLEQVGDILWTREIVVLERKKFAVHDATMDELALRYRMLKLAMDQTGMGEKPVEDAMRRYGETRVEGVLFTAPNKQVLANVGKEAFDDRKIRIPAGDPELRADLHKIKKVTGETGIPRFLADSDADGHADRCWACFLALYAADIKYQPFKYQAVKPAQDPLERHIRLTAGFNVRKGLL
jgi:phage FluMu gp28-like protein